MASNIIKVTDWLSTGSTMLNLALTGHPDRGFAKGKYFWMVGDSSSGKTFLMCTCLAEASINPEFDDYDFVYDNVEDGALMDFSKYFGKRMAKRTIAPAYDGKLPIYSTTIEDFYFRVNDRLDLVEQGKAPPFIWLLDSMDALTSNYEEKKVKEKRREWAGGQSAKGDYGDGKAKLNSNHLRRVISRLRKTGCILLILSQTRDNIGGGMFDPAKTHAGGHALKFYAAAQIWSSRGGAIKKTVRGKDREIGLTCRVAIKKNRMTGKEWTVTFPIYNSVGVDDVGACVDFLVEQKEWPKSKQGIIDGTEDIDDCKGRREQIIKLIEDNELEEDLREIVAEVWDDIEQSTKVERKNRYE